VQLQVAPLQLLPTMEAVATEPPAAEPAQPPEEGPASPTAEAVPAVA
jgi:hypothetical protein